MEAVSKNDMKPLTKVVSDWVQEYFKNTDLEITEEGNRATYQFTCSDKGDFKYDGWVEVYEERPSVAVFLYAPLPVPERKRVEASCFLARVNFGLKTGRVEMSWDSGKIRFFAESEVMGGLMSTDMVNNMVDRGMAIMDDYLPGIVSVVHANSSAEDAYNAVVNAKPGNKAAPPSVDTLEKAWDWDRFLGSDPLRGWAKELQSAIENKAESELWTLVGRGAVIINSDENYCREMLRRVALDAGMKFIHVPAGGVMSIPPASAFRSMAPVLVYLEPERWIADKGGDDESAEDIESVQRFQAKLIGGMRQFNPHRPVVFATSSGSLGDVSDVLKQVNLFDRYMTLPPQSLETIGMDFVEQIGKDICAPSMSESFGKVGRLVSWNFGSSEQRELAVVALKRLHARHNRPLEFLDLVHISTHDLQEEGIPQSVKEEVRRQTAYHEAGHAIIAVLETEGKNVPDYTSIVPGASGFAGVTVESYGFYYATRDDDVTYQGFRSKIRVGLAGRAAEELCAGVLNISNGARGDLENANRAAYRAFALYGFAPSMDCPENSGSNLAVVFGKPTDDEYAHVSSLTRKFLAKEYDSVRDTLTQHRDLLDEVAERLMWDPIVDQSELAEICKKHDVTVCI